MADDLVERLQSYSAGCCGEYVPGRRCPACPHRIMDEAAVRIRELEAEREWRPMETAPKDGTRILLLYRGGRIACGEWDEDSHRKSPKPFFTSDIEFLFSRTSLRKLPPLGWQPLPPTKP